MANTYSPESIGIKAPAGGFQQGGWYSGRQYWGGTLSDPGVIHPSSNQIGSGQAVSSEVNQASSLAQGLDRGEIDRYLAGLRTQQQQTRPTPTTPQYSPGADFQPKFTEGGATQAYTAPQTINLPDLYESYTADSGLTDLQDKLAAYDREYTEAQSKIDDNPFLSEATRVGRIAKLEKLYANRTKNIRDEIATKKADIETKLNLQMKQFDLNSQQTKLAWDQFSTLLNAGALNNASGETIAGITRSTGIPSDAIYSAIKAKTSGDRDTQVIQSTQDSGEVTVSVIDKQTGEIISQSSLGFVGNQQTGRQPTESDKARELSSQMISALEAKKNSYGHVSPQDWQGAMASWIARGGTRQDFINNFQQYADPNRGDFDQVYFTRDL